MNSTTVKLYTANGDINQRWYAYYYLQQGNSKKRVRIYGQVNYSKDRDLRLKLLFNLQSHIRDELAKGRAVTDGMPKPFYDPSFMTMADLITKVLTEKKGYQKETAYLATKSHMGNFTTYLNERQLSTLSPNSIKKHHIHEFRTWLKSKNLSNRTVNNHMVDVDSFFNYIINNYEDFFKSNPCKGITPFPARSETHIAYTESEARQISEWLKENDQYLHFFCKFIIYCFLRPKEIREIKIGDIDFDRHTIRCSAYSIKTNRAQIKFIPDIFFNEIQKLKLHSWPKHFYLFTAQQQPGEKRACKDYFQRRFKTLKEKLKFSNLHTMYGLRHTFVCQLIENGADDYEVMKNTGHTTLSSFEKYKRSLMAKRPKDLSNKYSIDF